MKLIHESESYYFHFLHKALIQIPCYFIFHWFDYKKGTIKTVICFIKLKTVITFSVLKYFFFKGHDKDVNLYSKIGSKDSVKINQNK